MSNEKDTFPQHINRVSCDRDWIDASMVNALACTYSVDTLVWQDGMDPMIVGTSGFAASSERPLHAICVINIAMA
jgi:hypothetical protein